MELRNQPSKQQDAGTEWILLVHQLPASPTNIRVRTWRKLQRLGAAAIKSSVYVLPYNKRSFEDFQWLKQEIEAAGGEASVFRAAAVEGTTHQEIVTLFRKARDEEYAKVTADLDGLTGSLREQTRGRHLSPGRIDTHEAELDKLHKELERVLAIDFFGAARRRAAVAAYERCRRSLRASQSRREQGTQAESKIGASEKVARYQGRRWVTRRNLFIDRLASVWLIRTFIDPRARFSFVDDDQAPGGGIGFDLFGGEFTHRGEDCTFETLLKEFSLGDEPGLRDIAEIVHDMDLKDNKFNRSETDGLAVILNGLSQSLKDDRKLIHQSGPIFDGMHALFCQTARQAGTSRTRKKHATTRRRK